MWHDHLARPSRGYIEDRLLDLKYANVAVITIARGIKQNRAYACYCRRCLSPALVQPENHLESMMALTYPRSEEPPGKTEPYLLGVACGEIWAFPGGLDAERLMVTGRETANSFTVMNITGTKNVPIGFHYHNESHDVFLVVKGQVNVWVGDQCRTMNPGDFASIPPVCLRLRVLSAGS